MTATGMIAMAQALVADDKGLLAMDESTPTCDERFAAAGIPETVEARRAYRELIVTTPGLAESISGAILFDETIRQTTTDGTPFVTVLTQAGIIPGIKVDTDTSKMAGHRGETVTDGLDGLRDRLAEYAEMGARFAKWRAVFGIGDHTPSRGCIQSQRRGARPLRRAVPGGGSRPDRRAGSAHGRIAHDGALLDRDRGRPADGLRRAPPPGRRARSDAPQAEHGVTRSELSHPGDGRGGGGGDREMPLADGARRSSGGRLLVRWPIPRARFSTPERAEPGVPHRPPWALSFSFGRAIQQPALEIWHGDKAQVRSAQQVLADRARCNRAARRGNYSVAMEES
jgi:fructose-bisphosphate aldolase class I